LIKSIRDDVIKLEAYVAAAFKYDEDLTRIFEVGGYCLVSQLKKRYGESKAKRMIDDMESHSLIVTEFYSNSKYVYLTQNALKYLANKDNASEIIKTKKKNIDKFPAERVMIASIMKYEVEKELYFMKRRDYIKVLRQKILEIKQIKNINSVENLNTNKENYIKNKAGVKKIIDTFQQILKKDINIEIEKLTNELSGRYDQTLKKYDDLIAQSEEIEKRIDMYTKKSITLFDISKIIMLPKDKETLYIYIIDNTNIKAIKKYFDDVWYFEKTVGVIFKTIQIVFISYNFERYEIFRKRILNYIKRDDIKVDVKITDIKKCYYLQGLVERTANLSSEELEIKTKDKRAYEKIKKQLSRNDIEDVEDEEN